MKFIYFNFLISTNYFLTMQKSNHFHISLMYMLIYFPRCFLNFHSTFYFDNFYPSTYTTNISSHITVISSASTFSFQFYFSFDKIFFNPEFKIEQIFRTHEYWTKLVKRKWPNVTRVNFSTAFIVEFMCNTMFEKKKMGGSWDEMKKKKSEYMYKISNKSKNGWKWS